MSEYEPLFGSLEPPSNEDLDLVSSAFARASRPYIGSPWPWVLWALVLGVAAAGTPPVLAAFGAPGALMLWSVAILAGGAGELTAIRRNRARTASTLARWVFRAQGNLSLIAVVLSAVLIVRSPSLGSLLPGLWLLILGHSLFALGGLAYRPLRRAGLLYQAGGVASLALALSPRGGELVAFAATIVVANLWVAWSLARRREERAQDATRSVSKGAFE